MNKKLIGFYSPAPGSGKTTIANLLCLEGFRIHSFAAPLRRIAVAALTEMGIEFSVACDFVNNKKESVIPGVGVTARVFLQTLGTDWGRRYIRDDIWISCWQIGVESSGSDKIVVDDVRFPNEANKIIEMGGEMWKIVRSSARPSTSHASEGALDNWDGFARTIENDGTLLELTQSVLRQIENAERPF